MPTFHQSCAKLVDYSHVNPDLVLYPRFGQFTTVSVWPLRQAQNVSEYSCILPASLKISTNSRNSGRSTAMGESFRQGLSNSVLHPNV